MEFTRVRITIGAFGTQSVNTLEIECEFTVVAHELTPKPAWDKSRLALYNNDAGERDAGVEMTFIFPVLNKENMELEFMIAADSYYVYDDSFNIEVLLDEKWYRIPFVPNMGFLFGYAVDADTAIEDRSHTISPVLYAGVLPAGQYRLLKEFMLVDPDTIKLGHRYLAKEIVFAEFIVEEDLENKNLD